MTAICPHCGFHDIIPDASGLSIDDATLKEIGKKLFDDGKSPLAGEMQADFLSAFDDRIINDTERNEAIFLQYSDGFASRGGTYALTRIGMFYEFGTRFAKPDLKTAFSYYANDALATDGFALARMGKCLEKGEKGEDSLREAFQCYAHSAALNNDYGKMYLGDCYWHGIGVEPNPDAAGSIYIGLFHSVYEMFVFSHGDNPHILPELCLRLAKLLIETKQKDDESELSALRYALLGRFALAYKQNDTLFRFYELDDIGRELGTIISDLASQVGAVIGNPVYDEDTFYDSFDAFGNMFYLNQGAGQVSFQEGDDHSHSLTLNLACGWMLVIDVMNLYVDFEEGNVNFQFATPGYFYPKKRKTFFFVNVSISSGGTICFLSESGPDRDLYFEFDEDGSGEPLPKGRAGEA